VSAVVTCVAGLLMASFFQLANQKMPNATRNAWLLFLSPLNGWGGVPFNPPLLDAVTVIVCPPWLTDACAGWDMGIYWRVLSPEVAIVMGGRVSAAGVMSTGILIPWATACSIWGRMGSWGDNGDSPPRVTIWCNPPARISSSSVRTKCASKGRCGSSVALANCSGSM